MSKRDEFVDIAKSQVGVAEIPVNNVKYNTWYYGHPVSGRPGTSEYAWCVVFESWCANQVGILNSLVPKCNNVGVLRDWYKERGLYHSSNYTPKKGDLVVFKNYAHTGIVEYVDSQVHTIEGNSSDKVARHTYPIWGQIIGYCEVKFGDSPSPQPTPTPTGTIATIQSTLNARYGYHLAVDNIAGADTWKHLRMALQHELNVQYGAGLVEDGILGTASQRALSRVTVSYGARGNITWLIQACLNIKGYNTNGIDSIFGNGTKNAVGNFQRNNGLSVDFIVGKNTFIKLFN